MRSLGSPVSLQIRSVRALQICRLAFILAISSLGQSGVTLVTSTAEADDALAAEVAFHQRAKANDLHQQQHLSDFLDFESNGAEHLKKHLAGKVDLSRNLNFDNMEDTEIIFHFFHLHDFDKNRRLDGLELMAIFTDYDGHLGSPEGEENAGSKLATPHHSDGGHKLMEADELEMIVDRILHDHDADGDGFLTYAEVLSNENGILNIFDITDAYPPRPDGSLEPDPSMEMR